MLMTNICKFSILDTTERTCRTVCLSYFKLNLLCKKLTVCVQASNAGLLETLFTAPRSQIDLLMLTFILLPWVTMSCDLTPSLQTLLISSIHPVLSISVHH